MTSEIIIVERAMLKSRAFRSLSSTAKNVLFDFRMKCKISKTKPRPGRKAGIVILNNGELEYTYDEAQSKGMTRGVFLSAVNRLIETGFLDIRHIGCAGKAKDKNLYAVSERWRDYGTEQFIFKPRKRNGRQGRGFALKTPKMRAYWKSLKVQT